MNKTKVWVVLTTADDVFQGVDTFHGVFSTKEKAQEFCDANQLINVYIDDTVLDGDGYRRWLSEA